MKFALLFIVLLATFYGVTAAPQLGGIIGGGDGCGLLCYVTDLLGIGDGETSDDNQRKVFF